MKRKSILLIKIFLVLIISSPLFVSAQKWGGVPDSKFWNNWSINVNAGLTSYFGDLSYYDSDVIEKLSSESGIAYGTYLFYIWMLIKC